MMKNIIKSLCVLICIMSSSCVQEKKTTNNSSRKNYSVSRVIEKEKTKSEQKYNYSLIDLRNDYSKDSLIIIYSKNNSVWKSFKYDDFFSDKEIEPYASKPENNLLVFKVLNKENGFYEIVVNETTNNKKYIKMSNRNFKYLTLNEFVLTVAFIDVNPKTNSLYQEPNDKSQQLIYNKNEFYRPVKVSNNWLMIEDSNYQIYWVKWIDENAKMIIDLLYDA